jgi:hypothetical protein
MIDYRGVNPMSTATSDATSTLSTPDYRQSRAAQTGSAGPDETPCLEGVLTVVCIDCGTSVFDWSTPELDRCWQCAEVTDGQAASAEPFPPVDGLE